MGKNYRTIKYDDEDREFMFKLQANIYLVNKEKLTLSDCLKKIVKYFKNNNDRYKEMISQEIKTK